MPESTPPKSTSLWNVSSEQVGNVTTLARLIGLRSMAELVRLIADNWDNPQLQQVLDQLAADYRRQMVEQAARLRPGGKDE